MLKSVVYKLKYNPAARSDDWKTLTLKRRNSFAMRFSSNEQFLFCMLYKAFFHFSQERTKNSMIRHHQSNVSFDNDNLKELPRKMPVFVQPFQSRSKGRKYNYYGKRVLSIRLINLRHIKKKDHEGQSYGQKGTL